jgi:hypothetical protein
MNKRNYITGKAISSILSPSVVSDFNLKDQADFKNNVQQVASFMLAVAQELLLRINLPDFLDLTGVDFNLFVLASMYYGDVDNWTTIRDVNLINNPDIVNLPILEGAYNLLIPKNSINTQDITGLGLGGI